MTAADAHLYGTLALIFAWLVISWVVWVMADAREWPLYTWFWANLAALVTFGVWGVTR